MSSKRVNSFFLYGWLPLVQFICAAAAAQSGDSSRIKHPVQLFPVVARSIETSWSFGVAASETFHLRSPNDSFTRTSNLQALALYSLHHQVIAVINGSVYFPGEKFILNQQISFSYYPDKFWGLGKNTPDSAREHYDFKQFYIYLHPQRLLARNIFIGFRYEFQKVWDVSYLDGGLFDKENIPGRNGYHVSGLGASFTYDNRNNAFSPDKGGMFQFYFSHFNSIFGSDYRYSNFVIDLRKFIRLYGNQVLAIQAYGFFNEGEVPLRSLASFGGANSMRGYYGGRYRDKNQYFLQSEYRIPLFWRLGAVVFAGLGDVSSSLADTDFHYLKYSYGGGIRVALNKTEKLNLRLDYGIGRKLANGFYFQLGEAF